MLHQQELVEVTKADQTLSNDAFEMERETAIRQLHNQFYTFNQKATQNRHQRSRPRCPIGLGMAIRQPVC